MKPEIRKLKAVFVETCKSPFPVSSTWEGVYKQRLDFNQPYNGKRKRIIRMDVSMAELNYLEERIKAAKQELKARFLEDCGEIK